MTHLLQSHPHIITLAIVLLALPISFAVLIASVRHALKDLSL